MNAIDQHDLYAALTALPAGANLLDRLGPDPPAPVHVVGGAVRDLLLGGTPADLDLVVEGSAAAVAERLGGTARSHGRFGTVAVRVGRATYDIAQARRERYAHPGALPDVEPAPLAEDLLRRDFTVNAIAIALGGSSPGRLSAAPGALDDLAGRQLRVLHDASFAEDPTRLLRLVRYRTRLGFEIEAHTLALAKDAVGGGAPATVSRARIGNELRLLAAEDDPIAALRGLAELDLEAAIEPGLQISDPETAARALELLPHDGRRDLLALALATRGVALPRLRRSLDELEFEAVERDSIMAATRAPALAQALRAARRPSEIASAVGDAGPELVALAGAVGAERPARLWLDELRHVHLEIGGEDLLAAGVAQGPAIGAALRAALAAVLDGLDDGRDEQLATALRAAGRSG
jgi:tRNA nucleotidyltransferase (CCA-adding enzyme)